MAKSNGSPIVELVLWIVGILVALTIGFNMAFEKLTIPFLTGPAVIITVIAGWIVVIGAILSVIMAIFKQ